MSNREYEYATRPRQDIPTMTARELSNDFVDHCKSNQRICFILGAGASKTSGIDTGIEMVRQFRSQILERNNNDLEYIKKRGQKVGLSSGDCERIFGSCDYIPSGDDYFVLYDLLYGTAPEAGYTFIESKMSGASPSYGYYCLANILRCAETTGNLVITTNFDTLTEDSLFLLTGEHPLVLGHETLASFLDANIKRPVIAKIHRDYLLKPMSRSNEMEKLSRAWKTALKKALQDRVVVVVGYAGGDRTLMDFLIKERLNIRRLYWCTLSSDTTISSSIENVIRKFNGTWVKIPGFDQLMYQLAERLGFVPNEDELVQKFEERKEHCVRSYQSFITQNEFPFHPDPKSDINEQAIDLAQAIVRESERLCPEKNDYFKLLAKGWTHIKNREYSEAESCFTQALTYDNKSVICLWSRSIANSRQSNSAKAADDLRQAASLDSDCASLWYSRSLAHYRNNEMTEARDSIQKALAISPCDEYRDLSERINVHATTSTYRHPQDIPASNVMPHSDDARYYRDSLELYQANRFDEALSSIDHAIRLASRKAEYYYLRSLILSGQVDSTDANMQGEFAPAIALNDISHAIELDGSNPKYYHRCCLLMRQLNWFEAAETNIKKAIALDPENAEYHYILSLILNNRHSFDQALKEAKEACRLEPANQMYTDWYRVVRESRNNTPGDSIPI